MEEQAAYIFTLQKELVETGYEKVSSYNFTYSRLKQKAEELKYASKKEVAQLVNSL